MFQSMTGSPLARRSTALFAALLIACLVVACDSSAAGTASQPAQPAVAQSSAPSKSDAPAQIKANRADRTSPLAPVPAIGPAPALPAVASDAKASDYLFTVAATFASFTTVDQNSAPDALGLARWAVADGALQQQGDVDGQSGIYDTFALTGDGSATSYTAQAVAYSTGVPLGLVARYNKNGYYLLRVNPTNSKSPGWTIERYDVASKSYTVLATGAEGSGYQRFNWLTVSFSVQGSQLTASLDGRILGTVSDSSYAVGQTGLYAEASNGARFASFRIAQQ